METKELVEIVLSDLSGKLYDITTKAVLDAKGELTKELKETILLTQKATIIHSNAYEAVVKVLVMSQKNGVTSSFKNRAESIADKANKLRSKLNTATTAEAFYNKLAELEMVLYQLENYGVVKHELMHT